MTDTEAFIDFVVQYASDRFTRESVNAFLAVPQSSAVLSRWKSLFDGGQQQQILSELGLSQAQKDWGSWGALAESEKEYQGQLTLLKADLVAYQNELAALTSSPNANNTPLAIQSLQEDIADTQKGIEETTDKLHQIEVWKAEHPDTESKT